MRCLLFLCLIQIVLKIIQTNFVINLLQCIHKKQTTHTKKQTTLYLLQQDLLVLHNAEKLILSLL